MPPNGPIDLKKTIDYSNLKDRNILITGGASGFGAAFVRTFGSHGANIVLGDLQDGPGKDLETELKDKGVKSVPPSNPSSHQKPPREGLLTGMWLLW